MIDAIQSAKLKLHRAAEHLETIRNLVKHAASNDSFDFVETSGGNGTLYFRKDPPPEISIICGEVIHQMRSTMDYLAFDLVKLNPNGITLPVDWEKACYFPLWLEAPKKARVYNCFENILPGIQEAAFMFIESVQPYHSGPGVHNALRLIAKLSNVDKHRHLNITVPKVAVHITMEVKGEIRYDITRGGLKHTSQVVTDSLIPENASEVTRSFTHYITFDEPTVGDGPATLEVENVLEVCLEQVKTVIVPAFAQFFDYP
jgi:hypothetical protein